MVYRVFCPNQYSGCGETNGFSADENSERKLFNTSYKLSLPLEYLLFDLIFILEYRYLYNVNIKLRNETIF